MWSTQAIAAPEVIRTYQEGATTALYKQVRFGPQDCYSLGCILLWLWTGMLPFILTPEEHQIHGITSMAEFLMYYLKKQAQGVSLPFCCTVVELAKHAVTGFCLAETCCSSRYSSPQLYMPQNIPSLTRFATVVCTDHECGQ